MKTAYKIHFQQWEQPKKGTPLTYGSIKHKKFPTYKLPIHPAEGYIIVIAESVKEAVEGWEDFGGGIQAVIAIGPSPDIGVPHAEPASNTKN